MGLTWKIAFATRHFATCHWLRPVPPCSAGLDKPDPLQDRALERAVRTMHSGK
jgi:hypothetical protein